MRFSLALVDRGLVPDRLIRAGIRKLLDQRLSEQRAIWGQRPDEHAAAMASWLKSLRGGAIAAVPEKANEQHYEVPPDFFRLSLGPHLKYSSGLYPDPAVAPQDAPPLEEAEAAMLALTCARAQLAGEQNILELGCGWGSLTLWMAAHYPTSRIVAVSNSAPQRAYIEGQAAERGLTNITVLTRDMNLLESDPAFPTGGFDRVVSVEMFEHMSNWEALLARVHGWLRDGGLFFAHVFAHKSYAYRFEVQGASDWMSEHFFSGGIMPSRDQFRRVQSPLEPVEQWDVDGRHYSLTAEAWLRNLDGRRKAVESSLKALYGAQTRMWVRRWRVFFLACAELFGLAHGTEWLVSHNLLRRSPDPAPAPESPAPE